LSAEKQNARHFRFVSPAEQFRESLE